MPRAVAPLAVAALLALLLARPHTSAQDPAPATPAPATPAPPAAEPAPPDPQQSLARLAQARRDADREIRRKLARRATLSVTGRPLHLFLDDIASREELTIHLDETALQEDGILPDAPITGEFIGATNEQILNRILEPLGLTWLVEDEVLKVTTETRAAGTFFTRTYAVGRLLELAEERRQESADLGIDDESPLTLYTQFGGMGGLLREPTYLEDPRLERLANTIIAHTSGEWEPIDQAGGSLEFVQGLLVIRQTYRVHDEIAVLLDAMERAFGGEGAGGALAVPASPTLPLEDDLAVIASLSTRIRLDENGALREVLAKAGQAAEVAIVIDEVALQEEGISADESTSIVADDAMLSSALDLALEPLGLAYVPLDGVLRITTETRGSELLSNVIYETRDLEAAGYDSHSLVRAIVESTSGEWNQIDQVGGELTAEIPGMLIVRQTFRVHTEIVSLLAQLRTKIEELGPAKAWPDNQEPMTRFFKMEDEHAAASMRDALVALVAPESWKAEDGSSRIHVIGDVIVIRQPASIQYQVEDFLMRTTCAEAPKRKLTKGLIGGQGVFSARSPRAGLDGSRLPEAR